MKSSQLKKSRQWNYMMMTATMEGGGKTITPPSYAIVYRLSTLQEETNGKKYYGWTVAKEGFVPTKEIFTTGEAFALAVLLLGANDAVGNAGINIAKRRMLGVKVLFHILDFSS